MFISCAVILNDIIQQLPSLCVPPDAALASTAQLIKHDPAWLGTHAFENLSNRLISRISLAKGCRELDNFKKSVSRGGASLHMTAG